MPDGLGFRRIVGPRSDDVRDVDFLERLDGEAAQQIDDRVAVEEGVRYADLRTVAGSEGPLVERLAEAEPVIVDRTEGDVQRSAGAQHAPQFGQARPHLGRRPVQIAV